jgi:hypothetical protein
MLSSAQALTEYSRHAVNNSPGKIHYRSESANAPAALVAQVCTRLIGFAIRTDSITPADCRIRDADERSLNPEQHRRLLKRNQSAFPGS